VKRIFLHNRSVFTFVDDEDFEELCRFSWYSISDHGILYAARWSPVQPPTYVRMHRQILNAKPGQIVDHRNRNGLDNRRENLRFATSAQNNINRTYRGRFSPDPSGMYRARIAFQGKRIHLGMFATPEEAAKAYDAKALELYGEFANLIHPEAVNA
jgi:hypothetical protein